MAHKPTFSPHTLQDRNELAIMRTLMANKRTFLAWCRTAMALMGFGFILEKFSCYLQHETGAELSRALHEMGMLSQFAFAAGCLIILLDGIRFIRTVHILSSRNRLTSCLPELILVLALAVIVIAGIMYSHHIIL